MGLENPDLNIFFVFYAILSGILLLLGASIKLCEETVSLRIILFAFPSYYLGYYLMAPACDKIIFPFLEFIFRDLRKK